MLTVSETSDTSHVVTEQAIESTAEVVEEVGAS